MVREKDAVRTLYTIGHSTRSIDELVAILRSADVRRVIDIRKIPRSRTNPQYDMETLPAALAAHGVAYTLIPALGGRRGKSKQSGDENAGWQVQAFRNYADYAQSETFRAGLEALLALSADEPCAIMCAEAVWWRCHRRIVADHVLARGIPVVHLLSETKHEPAQLTPFAVVSDEHVSYPATA